MNSHEIEIVIFDIDDTIVTPFNKIQGIRSFINKLIDRGYKIILLTARPIYLKFFTIEQINIFGLSYHDLFMRYSIFQNIETFKFKQIKILKEKYEIKAFFEDRYKTINYVVDRIEIPIFSPLFLTKKQINHRNIFLFEDYHDPSLSHFFNL